VIQRIRANEYREQPWKNSGGLTREIAAAFSGERALWRLSLATIEHDGPFSEFRGYDRTIVAIDGGVVELEVEGQRVVLGRAQPYDFPGEARVTCRVTGSAARDLNVLTLRDDFVHDCEIIAAATRFVLDDDELVFVYAIEGTATALGVTCNAGDTLRLQLDDTVEILTTGSAAVVRVTPL
jgi:environmental stress-induced protein Ves